jgi:hypothetical protein
VHGGRHDSQVAMIMMTNQMAIMTNVMAIMSKMVVTVTSMTAICLDCIWAFFQGFDKE